MPLSTGEMLKSTIYFLLDCMTAASNQEARLAGYTEL